MEKESLKVCGAGECWLSDFSTLKVHLRGQNKVERYQSC